MQHEGDRPRDIGAAALGALAGAIGAWVAWGVVNPGGGDPPGGLAFLAVLGLVIGMGGLYVAPSRGLGRKTATFGTSVAFVGLGIYLGAIAVDALIDYSQRT